jgi:hypothetical protein
MTVIREVTTVGYGLEFKFLQMTEGDCPRLNASETPLLKDVRRIINDTNWLFSLTKYHVDEAEFAMKYGRILHLLKVLVLPLAIKAMTHFWDLDYHRFTFWNVDMTPTIEEYSVLTEFPEDVHKVYFSQVTATYMGWVGPSLRNKNKKIKK